MRLGIAIAIIIFTVPVFALENLSSAHFSVDLEVDPQQDCYTPGEKIYVKMGIFPKTSDYRVLLAGEKDNPRTYYFQSDLSDANWRLAIDYYQGGIWDEEMKGKSVAIEVKYFALEGEEKGISKLVANLSGIVPYCSLRICDFVLISAKCELCEANALPNRSMKVANEAIFKNDIKALRSKAIELAEKLKQENLYNEEDFKNVTTLLNSAEDFVLAKKFIDADKKLREAEEAINLLSDLTNRKLVEKVYSEVESKLSEIKKELLNISVLLEKIKESEKYVDLALEQKKYEDEFNALENGLEEAKRLIDAKKYGSAKEKLGLIGGNADSLKGKVNGLLELIKVETEKYKSTFSLPSLDPTLLLALAGIVFVVLGLVALSKLRKRRKWDELR
ncbi:MAG: hypothetical protein NZ879_06825 [Archaeoglobaceae archaeon]|nr:hypothetical protein [Archaeoglobaceae archaeon]MDW8118678.1 hypothetical protein [Archaeoglobaceae archaeon]